MIKYYVPSPYSRIFCIKRSARTIQATAHDRWRHSSRLHFPRWCTRACVYMRGRPCSSSLLFIMDNADRHGHFIYRRNTRMLGFTIHWRPFLAPFPSPLPFSGKGHPFFIRSFPTWERQDNAHATHNSRKNSSLSFPAFFKGSAAEERIRHIRKIRISRENRNVSRCALITV